MAPPTPRRVALDALARIRDGAYANLALPPLLDRSALTERDRHFVTELVYGTTRMRRACDHLVDRFVTRDVDPVVRDALRLGAYQLAWLRTPPHAAVGETVSEVPARAKGFVNAVLRRVADATKDPQGLDWPDDATRLSYPDWIVERMNAAPAVHERDDGYVQDPASQLVAEYTIANATAGGSVVDLCAAPGGKATLLAHGSPAVVVAAEVQPARARRIVANASTTGTAATVATVTADGRVPPLRDRAFDGVLVDAPCSGLGVLRRRADARWRIGTGDVDDLVVLQRALLDAAACLVRIGGVLVYSVCTLTRAEAEDNDEWLAAAHPELVAIEPPAGAWRASGRGALLLPQAADTDGMYVLGLRHSGQ